MKRYMTSSSRDSLLMNHLMRTREGQYKAIGVTPTEYALAEAERTLEEAVKTGREIMPEENRLGDYHRTPLQRWRAQIKEPFHV